MGLTIRQSTARTVIVGPILDADGVAVTDASVGDLKIAKNGASPAALNGSATLTHRNTGHYSLALTTSDTDTVGQAEIVIDDSTNAMPPKELTIIEEAIYDALFAASATGLLPANVTQFGGSNGTFSGGRPEVNTTLIEGSDATNQIRDAVVDDATRIDASALNTLSGHDPGETIMGATDLGTGSGLTSLASATNLATVDSVVDAIKAKTDNLPSDPADESLIIAAIDAIAALLGTPAGASVSADVAAVKSDTSAVKTVTDALPDSGALTSLAQASDVPTAIENADALLTRDWTMVTGAAARSVLNALRFLRNKWSVSSGTLTVTEEDDTTPAWTGTVDSDAGADPITGNTPD